METRQTIIASEGNNPADVFSMWSIEKIFTGMLVFEMLEVGVITESDLNKPIPFNQSIMNKLPLVVVDRLSVVTWHQIMTHRAGIGFSMQEYDEDKFQCNPEKISY